MNSSRLGWTIKTEEREHDDDSPFVGTYSVSILIDDGIEIAEIFGSSADAQLIAAAPHLLIALQHLLEAVGDGSARNIPLDQGWPDIEVPLTDAQTEAAIAASAAIFLATGQWQEAPKILTANYESRTH